MIRGGANPAHVRDLLGHEDFTSLGAYVRLAAQDLKEAIAKYHPREKPGAALTNTDSSRPPETAP